MSKWQQKRGVSALVRSTCHCAQANAGRYLDFYLPKTVLETLVDDVAIEGHWENILKCKICGQYWYQNTTCGHALSKYFEKISPEERRKLLEENNIATDNV